ncbi:MAG: D-alanyl-D-alanine carboxypeptidase/D-alanyl-D-alanine-endopeptidase [Pyrinomonadaceae bacterium]|nr:D-alanyl-D-alanine carboxypeptidase/D-alanyl-D-alanine-endopeptidase [Pyrinomonadaceae bacterium]
MKTLLYFTLTLCALAFGACRSNAVETNVATSQTDSNQSFTTTERGFERISSNVELPKNITLSDAPEDVALNDKIAQIVDKSEFRNARWGVFVVSLNDARVLAAQDAQKLFNPASIQKLLTTAVALDKLGAEYRWRTSVVATKAIDANGTLNGDLIIYGRGAPDFDSKQLAELAKQLKDKGLRKVTGDIIGDESYFNADALGNGWIWNEAQWYYGAEPSALTFNNNEITISVVPDEKDSTTVKVIPELDFVKVVNKSAILQPNQPESVGIKRGIENNEFYVWGSVSRKGFGARVALSHPSIWAASELKKTLEKNGVTISGATKSADWKSDDKTDIATATELASVESKPLSEIVKLTNKRSVNLYAELMLRTLGRNFGAEAPDVDAKITATRGDDNAGASVISKWLKDKGVSVDDTIIYDGSGLSRLDFISPETFGRFLIAALKTKHSDTFKDSLPIAATDGTLGGRLSKHKGKIIAKTGSETYVNSLAGYAENKNGEIVAFAIFCNNETRKGDAVRTIDEIASAIAEFPVSSDTDKNQR